MGEPAKQGVTLQSSRNLEGVTDPFEGDSLMARRCRQFDWGATALGPVGGWSPVLRAAVNVVLQARQPMILWWGQQLVQVYNDSCRPLVGERDSVGLAAHASDFWTDAWPIIGPELHAVLGGGAATWHEDVCIPLRNGDGQLVDRYWTYGYTPVRDGGRVGGILTTYVETTSQVVGRNAREQALLRSNELLEAKAAELEAGAEEARRTAAQLEVRTANAEAARNALAASEARYRTLRTSLDEAFCVIEIVVDPAGLPLDYRFLETNPAFARQTGLAEADGQLVRTLIPGIEEHWIEAYHRVATTGVPLRMQNRSAGLGRWFEVFAFRVDDPGARHVAILVKDITESRRVAKERERLAASLEMERARLVAIIDMSPAFICVLDGPQHVIRLTNDRFDALAGRRNTRGRPVAEALPETTAQGFVELLDRVIETGEPFIGRDVLYRRPTPSGGEEDRYLDFVYQALTEADGTRSGVFVHGVDVTDQVRARGEVEYLLRASEAARHEAEIARGEAERSVILAHEANQAKSTFLATMSHELRTPIHALLGYAQLLDIELPGPLNHEQRGYLQRLTASGHHLLGLVNEVLDLAHIEAGGLHIEDQSALTGPPLQDALDLVRPQAAAKGVQIVAPAPHLAGEPFVGDEARVRQILLNLLSNAIKFTPAGGSITVTSTRESDTPGAASCLSGAGPWAAVRIADTGVGIDAAEQRRIFEAFHQIDGGMSRVQGGTGLGLTISRRLACLMGGDLTVQSVLGEGSTFTLWLPASRQAPEAPESVVEWTTALVEQDPGAANASELSAVGEMLRAHLEEILDAYTDRLRLEIRGGQRMRRVELEDHALTLLADLAQSMLIVGEAGTEEADLLRDGTAIQRTVAEQHGARRHVQGWDLDALHRDYQVLCEEVERVLRARLPESRTDTDAAMEPFVRLLARAESVGARAWQRAAAQADGRPIER